MQAQSVLEETVLCNETGVNTTDSRVTILTQQQNMLPGSMDVGTAGGKLQCTPGLLDEP